MATKPKKVSTVRVISGEKITNSPPVVLELTMSRRSLQALSSAIADGYNFDSNFEDDFNVAVEDYLPIVQDDNDY